MKNYKLCFFSLIILFSPILAKTQDSGDTIRKFLNQVNIDAVKANKTTPVAFTNISKDEITKANLGQDITYIMSSTPSVVTTSDAGAGIGYTSLKIRGSDQTRINVTINGIPINDSESQGVWWVNMPDLASSIENIQIQRGVGTSTNGGSAFGATINLNTNNDSKNPYTLTNNSIGSFNTIKNNVEFGTGLLNNHFSFNGRLSKISSDGYIDRAFSNLQSLYLQGTYFTNTSMLKALVLSGKERTYQAWYGVPLNYLDTARTYNPYSYENEVDNYAQTHYQLHYNKKLSKKTNYNISLHYTHGQGYYEQEKLNESLADYGLQNIILSNDTISSTDLIRRKWLNNHFRGVVYSINHTINNLNFILGGSSNTYIGDHYGNIIWAQYASNADFNHEYYSNTGEKKDFNFYSKVNYNYSEFTNIYIDLQRREIDYVFEGFDEDGNIGDQEISLEFFNPKIGFSHYLKKNKRIYASFAVANKEPSRNDYVESSPESRPSHETLYDFEIGYKQVKERLFFGINLYRMNYENQLVLTGKINDVGYFTRQNIDKSIREGIEIESRYTFNDHLSWNGNITLSNNKIESYTEYIDNWDTWGQDSIEHTNVDLAFSPNLVWASTLNYKLNNNLSIDLLSKYVGEQFIDNTSSLDRMLEDYLVNTLRVSYNWENKMFSTAKLTLQINNLLDNQYVSNAWVYRFISEGYDPRADDHYVNTDSERGYNMAAYFPEAGRNYLIGLTLGM